MSQKNVPLYEAMKNHAAKEPISFHVPGHKYGSVFPQFAKKDFEDILKMDVTELSGLDDLHSPTSVIHEAEELLAELYGVKKSYFLVNGSTVGNLAMILSVCNVNDIVLVQRNCHKSILNGLQLAGVKPVFLNPNFDLVTNVATYIPYDTIKVAIENFSQAKALILTNPNYYGMAIDLTDIVELAHFNHIPVLVDEAHGAHFIAGNPFPKAATSCGADIVVNSAHKTLPAMTMGSYLHFNSQMVDQSKLTYYLQALQSSSPSYPIMASLDLARYYLANLSMGNVLFIKKASDLFKKKLQTIKQIQVVESDNMEIMTDFLKITVQTRCSLTGYQLQALFEQQGLFTELADPFNVLFVLPLANQLNYEQAVMNMKNSLERYERIEPPLVSKHSLMESNYSISPICYQDMKQYNKKVIFLRDAIGKLSAQMVVPYPPGIPLIMIGEVITAELVEQVLELLHTGAKIQSAALLEQEMIEVFDV